MRAYVCACMIEENRTHDRHTNGTHDQRTREERGQTKFAIVGRSTRQQRKKVKKSLEITKKAVTLQKKQQNNNYMRNWYIKYSDAKKAEKITYREYCELYKMAKYYNCIISDYFHPHGKTLVVSFPKHFV